jgi:hypothetical protein
VGAWNSQNRSLASARRIIVRDPSAGTLDRTPPIIWQIGIRGATVGPYYVSSDTADLEIIAFDEGTGIVQLLVNDTAIAPLDSVAGYTWRTTLRGLQHAKDGNRIAVQAIDKAGNHVETSALVYLNSKPYVSSEPQIPEVIEVGDTVNFRIGAADRENDQVEVISVMPHPITRLHIQKNGQGQFVPGPECIGIDSIVVQLHDGYEFSEPIAWRFEVIDPATRPNSVQFQTRSGAFPPVLEAGIDTLRVTLASAAGTGSAPLTYSVRFIDEGRTLLSNDSTGNLVYAPAPPDTGLKRLLLTVTDRFHTSDSLTVSFFVAPRNQYPCSLSCTHSLPVLETGEIDMSSVRGPAVVNFVIHDKDHPLTEQYTVSVIRRNIAIVLRPDSSRTFTLAIDTVCVEPADTITVVVHDRTGSSDTVILALAYYVDPLVYKDQLRFFGSADTGATVQSGKVSAWTDQGARGITFAQAKERGKQAGLYRQCCQRARRSRLFRGAIDLHGRRAAWKLGGFGIHGLCVYQIHCARYRISPDGGGVGRG